MNLKQVIEELKANKKSLEQDDYFEGSNEKIDAYNYAINLLENVNVPDCEKCYKEMLSFLQKPYNKNATHYYTLSVRGTVFKLIDEMKIKSGDVIEEK